MRSIRPAPPPRPAKPARRTALALTLALLSAGAAAQDVVSTPEDIAERLRIVERRLGIAPDDGIARADLAALDRRLRAIELGLDERDRQTAAAVAPAPPTPPAKPGPEITLAADKGASIRSADGQVQLKLGALLQADHRVFLDDDAQAQNDSFLWRRIRPTLEGSWGDLVGFRVTPEFTGDSASIVDAYVDLKFSPAATVRVGKVKGPIGLERLQSGGAIALVERGFPTELAPNREIGAQLQGALASSKVSYVVGVYNGAADGRDSPTSNPDDDFEFAGRLFFEPWKGSDGALSGLGFGIAASTGDKTGAGNNFLPRYRTPGQATFFSYRASVAADGEHSRWSPQAYWYVGPVGLLGEYVRSNQELVDTATAARASLDHSAWQVVGSWVLTGEKASYRGVKPDHPFAPGDGGWGAFELVARYGRLDLDDDAFPLFADPGAAGSESTAWALGLNWYLTGNLKLVANYAHADFDGGAAGGDRQAEKTFFTRAQFSF
ncbi:OprO/OprP family phosphate-selective porin [Luteimonas saliphila]|uniref:OprO/OprP family phosphate-selective porin n=1 Tax=Luteimonas saliphila TaxID=2804919 RepID=UPI00192DAFBA|nr:porin [Luteimonas saliphila]